MYSRIKYLTAAAVLPAVLIISGCCGIAVPNVQPSPSPSAMPTPTPAATPQPSVTSIPGDKPYDIGNRLSMVYAVTQYDGMIKVNEYTDLIDYQKITLPNGNHGYTIQYISTTKGTGLSTMVTAYYDADGIPVNGTLKKLDNGRELEKTIMTYDAIEVFDLLNYVVKKADKASGYENVSVIAGMNTCLKFVSEDGGRTIWLAEKVPVPVKIENGNGKSKYVYELVSWSKL